MHLAISGDNSGLSSTEVATMHHHHHQSVQLQDNGYDRTATITTTIIILIILIIMKKIPIKGRRRIVLACVYFADSSSCRLGLIIGGSAVDQLIL